MERRGGSGLQSWLELMGGNLTRMNGDSAKYRPLQLQEQMQYSRRTVSAPTPNS
jgi:hypothetical protein